MNLDFSQKLLHYPLTCELQLSDIDFLVLPTTSIGEVVWRSRGNSAVGGKVGKEMDGRSQPDKPDTWTFLDHLLALFEFGDPNNDQAFEHITLVYPQTSHSNDGLTGCYGFVYFSDLTILPIRFEQSANFDAWIRSLAARLLDAPTVVFTLKQRGMSTSRWQAPDWQTQTTACLQANIPKLYKRPQIQAEKQEFLDSFQLLASMRQDIDTAETERLWRSFMEMTPSLQTPSQAPSQTPDERQELETRERLAFEQTANFEAFAVATGYELPPELKVIYRLTDGATADFMGPKLMPLAQVIQAWKNWKSVFDEWTLEELTGNNEADGEKTLGIYTNPYWIPLIDTAAGNFMGMDMMPGKLGKVGQIIHFGADTDLIRVEAASLNDFLFFEWDYYEAIYTAQSANKQR